MPVIRVVSSISFRLSVAIDKVRAGAGPNLLLLGITMALAPATAFGQSTFGGLHGLTGKAGALPAPPGGVIRGESETSAEVGVIRGVTRDAAGKPVPQAEVTVLGVRHGTDLKVISGAGGAFQIDDLKPGRYELTANKAGFVSSPVAAVELAAQQSVDLDMSLGASLLALSPAWQASAANSAAGSGGSPGPRKTVSRGFFGRLIDAYAKDWKPAPDDPEPKRRGWPAPLSSPPYPGSDWPYGGSPTIGTPDTGTYPLMDAIYGGENGKAWEDTKVKIYGWINAGFNVSTSSRKYGSYGNLPAAYYEIPNSFQLDQAALYIERFVDTVQKDHFDWGFRIASIYGLDYRFTTAKGVFSNQLLGKNRTYGFDPVMVYADLYFPKVADGLNVRIGRYISLPDIEAQLAPNNYTYSHSLTYTYDCYTQTGINATLRINDHWLVQAGLSAGCEAVPWTRAPDPKPTFNACVAYYWNKGKDDIYVCDNSTNSGKYAYNNLQAYYATWYHKFNEKWHTATEYWYMWEKDVPSIFGPLPAETNANGAWCKPGEDKCFAPEHAVVNYVERQFTIHDSLSIRNEYFDDQKGQRTGFKTRYTEHLLAWNHWIGSTVTFRPELRFERSYDQPAYNNGTKKNQLIFGGDVIFHF